MGRDVPLAQPQRASSTPAPFLAPALSAALPAADSTPTAISDMPAATVQATAAAAAVSTPAARGWDDGSSAFLSAAVLQPLLEALGSHGTAFCLLDLREVPGGAPLPGTGFVPRELDMDSDLTDIRLPLVRGEPGDGWVRGLLPVCACMQCTLQNISQACRPKPLQQEHVC